MTPTTDTLWGWFLLSILAVTGVGMSFVAGAAVVAIWDAVLARRSARLSYEDELQEMRDRALGFCQVVDVDGHAVRIQSDRAIDKSDRAAVDLVVRLIRDRLEGQAIPDWVNAR